MEQNSRLKISVEAFNEAKGDYRQSNAIFLPNISVSHTGFATTNPLMAFGSKLNQEIQPLYLSRQKDIYWHTSFAKQKVLYLQFNAVANKKEESIDLDSLP